MSENSISVATMNVANHGNGKKTAKIGKMKKRAGLKLLQPSANNAKHLVGNKRENFFTPKKSQKRKCDDENNQEGTPTKIAKIIKPTADVKIFQDPEPETVDKEAYGLMVQDTVPESYWEEVAEQRRLALSDALDENEKLHIQIDVIKEENRRLSAVADQAEYFASVIKMLTEDDDEKEKDKENDDDKCKTETADSDEQNKDNEEVFGREPNHDNCEQTETEKSGDL